MITRKHIINIVGECEIKELAFGIIHIDIKYIQMDKVLILYEYCFNNLPLSHTISTNIDNKLSYQDFIKYKLGLLKEGI